MPPVNRRDLLKAASGAATITGLTSVVGASENSVEIVTVRAGDETVRTAKVPKSWYQRVKHTRSVYDQSADEILDKRGVLSVSRTAGDQRFGGKRAPVLRTVYDPDTYKGDVPDEVDGVRVRKEEGKRDVPTCLNQTSFNPIPGGVHLNETADDFAEFTSFATAERYGTNYLLTCAHPWDACRSEIREGEAVDQYFNEYGDVDGFHPYIDVARTRLTDVTESFVKEIAAANQTYTVTGVATEDGVDNYMSMGTTIRKTAINTGDTTGTVEEMNVQRDNCPTLSYEGVTLSNPQARGDSGSPGFRGYSDGRATLVNINTFGVGGIIREDCGKETFNDSRGTAAYHIETYGYSFT